jgi:hypothetical protein
MDLAQSEVGNQILQAPIAYVTRAILASHSSIRAVMAVGSDGGVLAHERALDSGDDNPTNDEYPFLFQVPQSCMLMLVRTNRPLVGAEIQNNIMRLLRTRCYPITQ